MGVIVPTVKFTKNGPFSKRKDHYTVCKYFILERNFHFCIRKNVWLAKIVVLLACLPFTPQHQVLCYISMIGTQSLN